MILMQYEYEFAEEEVNLWARLFVLSNVVPLTVYDCKRVLSKPGDRNLL